LEVLTRSAFCLSALCENYYHQFSAQLETTEKSVNLFRAAGLRVEVFQLLKTLAIVKRHLLYEVPLFILNLAVNLSTFCAADGVAFPRGYTAIV
jgi:hypothetical protein